MKIVIAPDSFKGSLTAEEAADAMEAGVLSALPGAKCIKIPVADGGEGTVSSLCRSMGGKLITEEVSGPLGQAVQAAWCQLPDATAVIEMAAASGLILMNDRPLRPKDASTYGTGQLIVSALNWGCKTVIIGIGGSATTDGGAGMARALGYRFYDARGEELPPGGGALADLAFIDDSGADPRLKELSLFAACDVDNPLYGPTGAAFVYGPQKGATSSDVLLLDEGLRRLATVCRAQGRGDLSSVPGAGAAGGLGFGLKAFAGAALRPGVELILDACRFDDIINDADLIITGEGRCDSQTLRGKVPLGVAKRAAKAGVPVALIAGGIEGDPSQLGMCAWRSITGEGVDVPEAMERAAQLTESAAAGLIKELFAC